MGLERHNYERFGACLAVGGWHLGTRDARGMKLNGEEVSLSTTSLSFLSLLSPFLAFMVSLRI